MSGGRAVLWLSWAFFSIKKNILNMIVDNCVVIKMSIIQSGHTFICPLLSYSYFFLLILKETKIKPFSWAPESVVTPKHWVSCASWISRHCQEKKRRYWENVCPAMCVPTYTPSSVWEDQRSRLLIYFFPLYPSLLCLFSLACFCSLPPPFCSRPCLSCFQSLV